LKILFREDGFDIYCSTQYIDKVQTTVASVLGVQLKDINIREDSGSSINKIR